MEGTHIGAAHEELWPVGMTYAGEVCEGLSLVEQGKSGRSPSEEESAAETTSDGLITTPIPQRHWWGEGTENQE